MRQTTKIVARCLNVEYCKIVELSGAGDYLLLRAGTGWKRGYVGRAHLPTETGSQAGYTLMTGRPVVVSNLATDGRFTSPPLLADHHVTSGVSVVISLPERPYGVLGAHTKRQRTFSSDDVSFVQSVANILAASIEHDRARRGLELAARELEGQARPMMLRGNPYRLTFRELTVLQLVAAGRADKEIAAELGISPLTVHKHVSNILAKMNAASRTEAGTRAIREGLLD